MLLIPLQKPSIVRPEESFFPVIFVIVFLIFWVGDREGWRVRGADKKKTYAI